MRSTREPRIVIIGENQFVRQSRRWFAGEYRVRTTRRPETLTARLRLAQTDLVVADGQLDARSIRAVSEHLKRDRRRSHPPLLLIGVADEGASILTRGEIEPDDVVFAPARRDEVLVRSRKLVQARRSAEERDSVEDLVMSLAFTIEARDPYTRGHSQRLASYAIAFANRLALSAEEVGRLRRGAFLHDIGKVGIPDSLLLKPDRLQPNEYAVVKRHTVIGDRLCSKMHSLHGLRPIIRHHHERLDGTGYPDGLRHDAIPLLAQIMAIVDVFDALTTDRPYRPAWQPERAYDELVAEARRGWRRRDLVEEFIRLGGEGALAPCHRPAPVRALAPSAHV